MEKYQITTNRNPIAKNARPMDNPNSDGWGDAESNAEQSKSKSEMLEELMGKPETYEKIGSAWRLFFRLVTSDGVLIGTYKEIASNLGNISGDSLKNWAKTLKTEGIIEIEEKGRGKKIMLADEYMRIAAAPHKAEKIVEKYPPGYDELMALQKITQGASAFGGHVKLSLENCKLKVGNGKQSA